MCYNYYNYAVYQDQVYKPGGHGKIHEESTKCIKLILKYYYIIQDRMCTRYVGRRVVSRNYTPGCLACLAPRVQAGVLPSPGL